MITSLKQTWRIISRSFLPYSRRSRLWSLNWRRRIQTTWSDWPKNCLTLLTDKVGKKRFTLHCKQLIKICTQLLSTSGTLTVWWLPQKFTLNSNLWIFHKVKHWCTISQDFWLQKVSRCKCIPRSGTCLSNTWSCLRTMSISSIRKPWWTATQSSYWCMPFLITTKSFKLAWLPLTPMLCTSTADS